MGREGEGEVDESGACVTGLGAVCDARAVQEREEEEEEGVVEVVGAVVRVCSFRTSIHSQSLSFSASEWPLGMLPARARENEKEEEGED